MQQELFLKSYETEGENMRRVKCEYGHYYDEEKYASCPHCAEGAKPIIPDYFTQEHQKSLTTEQQKNKHHEIDKRHEKKKEPENAQYEEKSVEKRQEKSSKKLFKGLFVKKEKPLVAAEDDDNKTELYIEEPIKSKSLSMSEPDSISNSGNWHEDEDALTEMAIMMEEDFAGKPDISIQNHINEHYEQAVYHEQSSPKIPIQNYENEEKQVNYHEQVTPEVRIMKNENSISFSREIRNAKNPVADEGKTIGFFGNLQKQEPPVGYLICVKGEDYGNGFLIKSGHNNIGRSQTMDIVIMDPKVSRERQAVLTFDPMNRDFYISPGEASGLCYVNGTILLNPVKICAYDRIRMGDSELMLIPVCGEKFGWDETS